MALSESLIHDFSNDDLWEHLVVCCAERLNNTKLNTNNKNDLAFMFCGFFSKIFML